MYESETKLQLLKTSPYDPEQKEIIRDYLKKKNTNEDFINDILKYGLVESCIEALLAEGLTLEDIDFIKNVTNSDICRCSSTETVVSREHVEAEFLKIQFKKILSTALLEIVMKRPFDPIEYLGHWLLHYRCCEEREKRRKEFEAELYEERLKWQEANKNRCPMFKQRYIGPHIGESEEEHFQN